MNVIRTKAVELSVIPALAYKLKLKSGGAGVKLLRLDRGASAVATIDKRSGDALPYGKVDAELFPEEAFAEAIELTEGLPYSARGKIAVNVTGQDDAGEAAVEAAVEAAPEKTSMVGSDEYEAIVSRFSDERGKLNYKLMNKDFIQFAAKSKTVAKMVAEKASEEDILAAVIKSRATFISGKKESLDDGLVAALIETLDEIDPRSAFKELKIYIRKLLAVK